MIPKHKQFSGKQGNIKSTTWMFLKHPRINVGIYPEQKNLKLHHKPKLRASDPEIRQTSTISKLS
jgi:hypothetical protein